MAKDPMTWVPSYTPGGNINWSNFLKSNHIKNNVYELILKK